MRVKRIKPCYADLFCRSRKPKKYSNYAIVSRRKVGKRSQQQ